MLSNREIARRAGCSHVTISLWRRGERRVSGDLEARILSVIQHAEAEARHNAAVRALGAAVLENLPHA